MTYPGQDECSHLLSHRGGSTYKVATISSRKKKGKKVKIRDKVKLAKQRMKNKGHIPC